MKNLFFKYFLLAVILIQPFVAFSQEKAEELKICKEGLEKCNPLIKDIAGYKLCMRATCSDFYNDQEFEKIETEKKLKKAKEQNAQNKIEEDKRPLEEIKTCDYGLRKCNSLKENKEYYWECVNQECKNPDNKANPACGEGLFLCEYEKSNYHKCLVNFCPLVTGKIDKAVECAEGKAGCAYYFEKYWDCNYAICLGPVNNYKKPAKTRKYVVAKDKNGKKQIVVIDKQTSDEVVIEKKIESFFFDKGIDYRELKNNVPQKFRAVSNPSSYLYCLYGGMIRCKTNDARSCQCSDGSSPINMNGDPDPRFSTE